MTVREQTHRQVLQWHLPTAEQAQNLLMDYNLDDFPALSFFQACGKTSADHAKAAVGEIKRLRTQVPLSQSIDTDLSLLDAFFTSHASRAVGLVFSVLFAILRALPQRRR